MIQLIIAIVLDSIIGDPPDWPHPIRLVGWVIERYEKLIRKIFTNLYFGGFVLVFMTILTCLLPIIVIQRFTHPIFFNVFQVYVFFSLLATKCMAVEANRVMNIIKSGDLSASRESLSYLVGRDTKELSEKQVIKGLVETVSENTIDGTLAPLFYIVIGFILGLPMYGLVVYKIVNTLDSMVGYIQSPYKEIGYCSAKLDDILNYFPARLGALIMLLAGAINRFDVKSGFYILKRDRRNHKSPNCGYPESVTAGLLNIQLGGTNTYFGQTFEKPTIGDSIVPIGVNHITDVLKILWTSQWIALCISFIILYFVR